MDSDPLISIDAKPVAMKNQEIKFFLRLVNDGYEFEIQKPLFSLRCLRTHRLKEGSHNSMYNVKSVKRIEIGTKISLSEDFGLGVRRLEFLNEGSSGLNWIDQMGLVSGLSLGKQSVLRRA